jgi:hypothetical protein
MPSNKKGYSGTRNLDTTMNDVTPHKQGVKLISEKIRDLNRSQARLQKSKIDYYKNHHGSEILVPMTKRLNWNIINTFEAAANPDRGKRREFIDNHSNKVTEASHHGSDFSDYPDVCSLFYKLLEQNPDTFKKSNYKVSYQIIIFV